AVPVLACSRRGGPAGWGTGSVDGGAGAPQLPVVLRRPAGLDARHVDADHRPDLAGAGHHPLGRQARHRLGAAVPAGAAARAVWVIACVGATACVFVNAGLYVFVLISLLALRSDQIAERRQHSGPVLIRDGLTHVRERAILFRTLALTTAVGMFGMNFMILVP